MLSGLNIDTFHGILTDLHNLTGALLVVGVLLVTWLVVVSTLSFVQKVSDDFVVDLNKGDLHAKLSVLDLKEDFSSGHLQDAHLTVTSQHGVSLSRTRLAICKKIDKYNVTEF